MGATRIIETVQVNVFKEWIRAKRITINQPHVLMRLSEAQRNIFKEEELIRILKQETPVLVGLQKNGRHAALFRRPNGFMRIVFQLSNGQLDIRTFYETKYLPQLNHDE